MGFLSGRATLHDPMPTILWYACGPLLSLHWRIGLVSSVGVGGVRRLSDGSVSVKPRRSGCAEILRNLSLLSPVAQERTSEWTQEVVMHMYAYIDICTHIRIYTHIKECIITWIWSKIALPYRAPALGRASRWETQLCLGQAFGSNSRLLPRPRRVAFFAIGPSKPEDLPALQFPDLGMTKRNKGR